MTKWQTTKNKPWIHIWIFYIYCRSLANKMFHEFYKHSFWYVRVDATWNDMVPYNWSPITYIRSCQVTFNNWNMKIITLSNTDCGFLNSGVITLDKSDVHAIGKDQRSKIKVTEVKTQLSRFRPLTTVWIHGCLIVFQGHPSNFKVIRHKISLIWT